MGFREMIKRVQIYLGFSDVESRDALELMVECLAVRLDDGERKDFASQLPQQLQDIALTVLPSEENTHMELVVQFMGVQEIDRAHAVKQIHAAWHVLKDAVTGGEINHIRAQLPNREVVILH
jgi:uncharacterized protein (DUF2267 family)